MDKLALKFHETKDMLRCFRSQRRLRNIASGDRSSVSGGADNTASGPNSAVSGGRDNTAGGNRASVSGGAKPIGGGHEHVYRRLN